MLESKGKTKTTIFLRHIQVLGQKASDRVVDGFQTTEKNLINRFTTDTEELINYNEWGIALENLLSNLYEIHFTLDRKAIDLAKDALSECKMDFDQWAFIEELVK